MTSYPQPPFDPRALLEWTLGTFPGTTVLTLSFGGGGIVLAHMLYEIDRTTPIVFLDTGLHFPETYEFKQRFTEQYQLNVIDVHPDVDPGALYATDPDRCCAIRKVEPLHRTLRHYRAWISALRRDQSPTRAHVGIIDWQRVEETPILNVYPLAYWTRADVWRYITDHNVPYHPLLDQQYTSIGCWPCTRPVTPGEHERAGRWAGTGKTECGIHQIKNSRMTSE